MGIKLSKGATHQTRDFPDIPDSIIAEIISALPVQSILRCRCVCKTWLHMISSDYFNNCVYKKRSSLTFILRGLSSRYFLFEFQHWTNLTKTTCYPVKPMKLNSDFGVPFSSALKVIGNCNGLLCLLDSLSNQKLIHMWNPVLSQYITFPIGELKDTYLGYGFGYSHITDQYKVFRILNKTQTNFVVEVLTLGPNTWRRVGNTHCRPNAKWGFCYFYGIVHWMCDDESHITEWICSFNISTEQLGFLSPPPDCTEYSPGRENMALKVVRNCLCVIKRTPKGFVLWSMKDYGVAASWSKHVFIEFPDSFRVPTIMFITGMWEDEEEFLFLPSYGNLGYFDSKKMQYVELKTTIDDGGICKSVAYPFIPSFLPLCEVFKEQPSKVLLAQNGCFRLLSSILRSCIYKCALV